MEHNQGIQAPGGAGPWQSWPPEVTINYHKETAAVERERLKIEQEKAAAFGVYNAQQHRVTVIGLALIGFVVLAGVWLIAVGNGVGERLVTTALAYVAGYLAGGGRGRLNS